ncbi:MAG: arylsulfatase [Blastocatellia bacterium]
MLFTQLSLSKPPTFIPILLAIIVALSPLVHPNHIGRLVNGWVRDKPNIIMILADDLGYGDLGSYGQKKIKTPFLDQMAAEGMRFTDCYSGSSVCSPARCSLMTGYHTGHAYIRANDPAVPLRPEDHTVAEALKQAGYATAIIGKWALGDAGSTGSPNRKGFDYSFGFLTTHEAHDYFPSHVWRDGQKVEVPEGTYSEDLFLNEALDFISRSDDNPFFLYLPVTIPHGPYQVPSDEPYQNEPWPQDMKNRAAMITRFDTDVSRIVALLKEKVIDDSTVIVVSSDNGPETSGFFNSNGALSGGKRELYEGGLRVPMIVRWPGTIQPAQVSRQVWAFWDFLPTVAEIAGANIADPIDGISILPTLIGAQQPQHMPLYWEFREKNDKGFLQAVRIGNWKGVRKRPNGQFELYDLLNDLKEENNVASRFRKTVKEIKMIMKKEHENSSLWPDH